MKISELIIQILLSGIAAYIVLLINQIVVKKKWFENLLTWVLILLVCQFCINLDVKVPLNQPTNFLDIISIVSILIAAISLLLLIKTKLDIKTNKLLRLITDYHRHKKSSSVAWVDSYSKEVSEFGLKMRCFPPVPIINYTENDFSKISSNKSLNEQIVVYKIIEIKPYVSWVDAEYWAMLRRLSEIGVSVTVCFYNKKLEIENIFFQSYVKKILGSKVKVDTSVYERFKLINEEQYNNQENDNKIIHYTKLLACSPLLPVFFGNRDTFILLWEGYYSEVTEVFKTLKNKIDIPIIENGNLKDTFSIELNGLKIAYILYPTAIGINEDGSVLELAPQNSFLLGNFSFKTNLERIINLPNDSIWLITKEIIAPFLRSHERLFILTLISIILGIRSNKSIGKKGKSISFITWNLTKACAAIHSRII